MVDTQPTQHDAELILKLYDLRREQVMREARAFVAQFAPKSLDDMLKLANAFGTKEQAYLRQVAGYWEMAASLVNRGALNGELALNNNKKFFFFYAKPNRFTKKHRGTRTTPNSPQQGKQPP